MVNQRQFREDGGDKLELDLGDRPFDLSATAWLIGQGVRYLNTSGEEGDFAYKYVVELLSGRKDAVETLIELSRRFQSADFPFRWNLLYVLGDVGDQKACNFLAGLAVERLPEELKNGGCEGPRDGEILVRTMAVEALRRIATRYPDTVEYMLKVVAQRPARPILIEAVKAAISLGIKDRVTEILPKEDHWILDIRLVRIDEVYADPERGDADKRGFAPPKIGLISTAPNIKCRIKEGE